MVIFKVRFGCHEMLILGKSPIKLRQRYDLTISVIDCDVNHQFKQAAHLFLTASIGGGGGGNLKLKFAFLLWVI